MIKNEVLVQSPTRIDFAGGTLDCWPINALMSPVSTINAAISIYTTCRLSAREDQQIVVHSRELNKTFEFSDLEECLQSTDPSFQFFREHINYWNPSFGFNLSAMSDSPIGGGLGGSSSLSISIFKAFSQLLEQPLGDEQTIQCCSGIEAKILGMPTGTQDYIPPLRGGLNIIDYIYGAPSIQTLDVTGLKLGDKIAVFYTGRSHHSGINNWQVLKSFIDGDKATKNALATIKSVADQTRIAILEQAWDSLPNLFNQEYKARVSLASSFSSPEIEKLAEVSMAAGADAINICGAGGGGCVFTWSAPDKRTQVVAACTDAGFQHLDIELV